MVRNESDVGTVLVDYPYYADYEIIEPIQVLLESQVQIMAAYNATNGTNLTDIFKSSFNRHSVSFWMGMIILLIVAYFILRVRWTFDERRRPVNRYHLYDAITYLFKYESTEFDDLTRQILCLFLTLASFYVLRYFQNFMATDLVVAQRPEVIKTFEDIIDRKDKLQAVFALYLADHLEFRDADEGSIKKKLWNVFSDTRRRGKFKSIFWTAKDDIMRCIVRGASGKVVFLTSEIWTPAIMSSLCRLKATFKTHPNVYPFVTTDTRADKRQKAMLIRHDWMTEAAKRNDRLYRNLRYNPTRQLEGGIIKKVLSTLDEGTFTELADRVDPEDFASCMRYTELHMPTPGITQVTPFNLKFQFQLLFYLFATSYFILFVEKTFWVLVQSIDNN